MLANELSYFILPTVGIVLAIVVLLIFFKIQAKSRSSDTLRTSLNDNTLNEAINQTSKLHYPVTKKINGTAGEQVGVPNLDLAVKLIKNGKNPREIKEMIDLEPEYLEILSQRYCTDKARVSR